MSISTVDILVPLGVFSYSKYITMCTKLLIFEILRCTLPLSAGVRGCECERGRGGGREGVREGVGGCEREAGTWEEGRCFREEGGGEGRQEGGMMPEMIPLGNTLCSTFSPAVHVHVREFCQNDYVCIHDVQN